VTGAEWVVVAFAPKLWRSFSCRVLLGHGWPTEPSVYKITSSLNARRGVDYRFAMRAGFARDKYFQSRIICGWLTLLQVLFLYTVKV